MVWLRPLLPVNIGHGALMVRGCLPFDGIQVSEKVRFLVYPQRIKSGSAAQFLLQFSLARQMGDLLIDEHCIANPRICGDHVDVVYHTRAREVSRLSTRSNFPRNCSPKKSRNPSVWYRLCHRSEEHTSELQSLRHLVCRL